MARVTVEDCLKNVKNRFELVIIAAKRARQLMRGKEAKVDWDNDKSTVVALREIAAGFTQFDDHHHEPHHEEEFQPKPTPVMEVIEIEEDIALGNEAIEESAAPAAAPAESEPVVTPAAEPSSPESEGQEGQDDSL